MQIIYNYKSWKCFFKGKSHRDDSERLSEVVYEQRAKECGRWITDSRGEIGGDWEAMGLVSYDGEGG